MRAQEIITESISGHDMLRIYKATHHGADSNTQMERWIAKHDWGIKMLSPEQIPDIDDPVYFDDPFGRVQDIDQDRVYYYRIKMRNRAPVKPIIKGPGHSIIDGNHRAQAAKQLGTSIQAYVPMNVVAEDLFIAVDVDAIHAEDLKEHLLSDPAIFESRADFVNMRQFLTLHATPKPTVNDSYVYASIMTTPIANFIHISRFNHEYRLVKLDGKYAYFDINGIIKQFPETGELTGDLLTQIYFFKSKKEFEYFEHLLILRFSEYKRSTKILDQPDLAENFADGRVK